MVIAFDTFSPFSGLSVSGGARAARVPGIAFRRRGGGFLAVETRPAAPRLALLVPAYFYPDGAAGLRFWDALIAAGSPRVPLVIIANPASGPGASPVAAYRNVIGRAAARPGIIVVGYVATGYGKRPAAAVRADITSWRRFYPGVRGIFFDEQASGVERVGHYAALAAVARAIIPNALLVSNPGVVCAPDYLKAATGKLSHIADVFCIFENRAGFDRFLPPDWTQAHAPDRFAALAYDVRGASAMRRLVEHAVRRRIGFVYVTDDGADGNPWDSLPGYWAALVAAVRRVNG